MFKVIRIYNPKGYNYTGRRTATIKEYSFTDYVITESEDAEVLEKSTEDFSNDRVKSLKKFTVKVWDSLNNKWKIVSTNLVNNYDKKSVLPLMRKIYKYSENVKISFVG